MTFLDIVVKDLLAKRNGDFHNVTVVFPNKRASLFFNRSLAEQCEKPVWSPKYTTISELFRRHSALEVCDQIKLICELHKSYCEVTKSTETFDQFYSWGEMMLADFDDIDKHLVDASKVFTLIGDLHEMDDVDYLTDEQKKVLEQFFSNFTPDHTTELKKRFLQLWNKFFDIYTDYRKRLEQQGVAYEGMLYREVAEQHFNLLHAEEAVEENEADADEYIFVGFNLLNKVEEQLFTYLMKQGRVRFYWDFDEYYMRDPEVGCPMHEAGRYIRQHLTAFPNELETTHEIYKQFASRKERDITFISSPTNDLQARYISQWLTPERIAAGRHTAIVLGDESLLESVLHSMPPEVKHLNITTGFPLAQSPISSFVRLYLLLLQHKTHTLHNVNALLRHPYIKYVSEKSTELHKDLNNQMVYYPTAEHLNVDDNMTMFFAPLPANYTCNDLNERLLWAVRTIAKGIRETRDDFALESIYRMYTILNRLSELLGDSTLQLDTASLYLKLMMQIIQSTTIPFHGEPIEGIQVMGVLETRNLDFEHLLVLSCNEGNLPAKVNDSSFIPHSVRKAYGLTTVENKVAIYSYYFHRLLQRTQDAHLLYCNADKGNKSSEMSRFMLQMIADNEFNIQRKTLAAGQEVTSTEVKSVEKTDEIMDILYSRDSFSPSALGKYLRCPLQFYYIYVKGIRDDDEGDEADMDNRTFGSVFHKAAELVYKEHLGRVLPESFFDSLLNEKGRVTLNRIVDDAIRTEMFNINDDKVAIPKLGGFQVISRDMVMTFLCNLLKYDRQCAPLTIIKLEKKAYDEITVNTTIGEKKFMIGGFIDRLDCVTNEEGQMTVRIIDYKTGKPSDTGVTSIEEIFDRKCKPKKHPDYYLQALLYSYIVDRCQKSEVSIRQEPKYDKSLTAEEMRGFTDYPISAGLLYVQSAAKKDYSPTLKIGSEPIDDAAQYSEDFIGRLKGLIREILDKDVKFLPPSDDKSCKFCSYSRLCGKG